MQSGSGKRTQKLSDPLMFTDDESLIWDNWSSKVADKLEINHNHYKSERAKIAYVLLRLEGEAAEHTYAQKSAQSDNSYTTAEEVI